MSVEKYFSLEGRVALITGASGYLGEAMSEALAEAGAMVYLGGRDIARLEALEKRFISAGYRVKALAFDLRDEGKIEDAVHEAGEEAGRLDVLVHNAHRPRSGANHASERADFIEGIELSVVSAHRLLHAALPYLRQARARGGSPSVIHIASMYGIVSPNPLNYDAPELQNPSFYGASKAALLQFTRHAAVHLAKESIRVNALSPGAFPRPEAPKALVDRLSSQIPLGRVGSPDELKSAILFLASPSSSYLTGANLVVDGGYTIV